MRKGRKIVAAGWYVSAALSFLLAGLPPAWLSTTPARALLCLLGGMCLCGAAYEWWWRKDARSETIADIQPVCDEHSAAIAITNRGEAATFSATLELTGYVRATALYCKWEDTPSAEASIAKGQTRRLILAYRPPPSVTIFPAGNAGDARPFTFASFATHWVIYALSDGMQIQLESGASATDDPTQPMAPTDGTTDVFLNVEIIANPDFRDGVRRFRIRLEPSKAVRGDEHRPIGPGPRH